MNQYDHEVILMAPIYIAPYLLFRWIKQNLYAVR